MSITFVKSFFKRGGLTFQSNYAILKPQNEGRGSMEIIVGFLGIILAVFFICSFAYTLRQPRIPPQNELRLPKAYSFIGIVCGSLFLIPAFICLKIGEPIILPLGFLAFSALGAVIVIEFVNGRISYDKEGFTDRTFFGKERKHSFSEIQGMNVNVNSTVIYTERGKVSIDPMTVGLDAFLSAANAGYKRHHKHRIPDYKNERDLFHGHIRDSGMMIFAYILVGVIFILFFILTIYIYVSPYTADNTHCTETSFTSFAYNKTDMDFTSHDGETYKIRYVNPDVVDLKTLEAICNGETLSVYYKSVDPSHGDYSVIKAVKLDHNFILDFSETKELDQKMDIIGIYASLSFILLWALFVVMSVKVGRNPSKYSKRVVKLFFKEEYVKY